VSGAPLGRDNVGFLLAKASQRWNELLQSGFAGAGFPEVRASYGSLLVPLFEEDGLRQGELARRARLSKQTLTTMARALESDGLIERRQDPSDARATLVFLTPRARRLRPVAERVIGELDAAVAAATGRGGGESLVRSLKAIMDLGDANQVPESDRPVRP
jgi:DNA-binding MarR family transcriptional regulator